MDFNSIKDEAKKRGCRITDMIALAPQNDPFYIGTKSQVELADWFTDLWQRFGYTTDIHLRRIHYRLISQETPIYLPNGMPYVNTASCSNLLGCASKYARYLGKVDPRAFDDRRNNRPIENMEPVNTEPEVLVYDPSSEFEFEMPDLPAYPYFEVYGYEPDQRYHLEIWAEKSTMNDILDPLCKRHKVNLITGLGELSVTQVIWLFDRLNKLRKPCRVFYVSDFDPAGQSMPVAVSRKIEKFMYDSGSDYNVRLFPMVLTHKQCIQYKLPRTPIKESEARAGKFEEKFGEGATELDALEALYPGELAKILGNAIRNYRDNSLVSRVHEAEGGTFEMLRRVHSEIMESYSDELSDIRNEYRVIRQEFNARISELADRIDDVWRAINDELETALEDITPYPVPTANEAEDLDGCLYDSNNNYFDQLKVYKIFQATGETNIEVNE